MSTPSVDRPMRQVAVSVVDRQTAYELRSERTQTIDAERIVLEEIQSALTRLIPVMMDRVILTRDEKTNSVQARFEVNIATWIIDAHGFAR